MCSKFNKYSNKNVMFAQHKLSTCNYGRIYQVK